MNINCEIHLLSQKFAADYPLSDFQEIMYKAGRPYNCLLIDADDYLICIPYRSHISHKNAFLFKGTQRSMRTKSGLDYSKLVLIKDRDYLDTRNAIVDQDEYKETVKNLEKIAKEVRSYIDGYAAHVNGTKILHPREYARKYQFSTLPYFQNILGV